MSGLPVGTGAAVARRLTPEPERELPRDPVAWVRGELDEHVWSRPRAVMRSVLEHRETMVPGAHGWGKSWTASRLAAYWIAAHPPGEAFVVTSAPSTRQVEAILWRELARAKARGGLPGRVNLNAEWYVGPPGAEELVAFGRKPQDLRSPEQARQAFQGIHARYVLVILDEATGIPKWLWDAADSLLTNEAARLLAIGNPDDPATEFAARCAPGYGANVIEVSAFDTPALTGERVPEHLLELLTSRLWVEERIEKWGADSPLYQSKVLARFPDVSDDKVVSPGLVRRAWERDLPGDGAGAYGLDVARFGRDKTVLYRVRDGVARIVDSWGKADTAATRERATVHLERTPYVPCVVDADGIGGGVYDEMRARGMRVVPFTVNQAAHNPQRYYDRRSEVWWEFRKRMEDGALDLDPDDLDLAAQLQQPRWWLQGGRIRVESKEKMADRGLPSPDRADAVIMATLAAPAVGAPGGYPATGEAAERRKRRGGRRTETGDLLKRPM